MQNFEQPILKIITEFFGPRPSGFVYMERFAPKRVPVWVKNFSDFYRVEIDAEKSLILIKPKESNDIEKVINLYRVLKNLEHENILIIADNFSAKSKQDLIRGRIPHITSSGSIFAPELGIIYKDTLATVERSLQYNERLLTLAQKLVVAYLLNKDFFQKQETLSSLVNQLKKHGYSKSISSISRAFHQLAQFQILEFEGNGPNKYPVFFNREIVWSRLLELEVETIIKKSGDFYLPDKNKYHWVYSNDSALFRLSDLNRPEVEIIAMANSEFKKWKSEGGLGVPVGDFGARPGVIIEIWRDNIDFLSSAECLNPIELALSLRRTREPRTQLAVSKVIDELGLNSNLLWERR